MENKKKDSKCVFNLGVARHLIRNGCQVVDLKPDKTNRDKTVVVFKYDEHFVNEFEKVNKEIAEIKSAQEAE